MTIKVYRVRPDGTTDSVSHEQIARPTEIPAFSPFDPCECPRHSRGWCDFHGGRPQPLSLWTNTASHARRAASSGAWPRAPNRCVTDGPRGGSGGPARLPVR